ncbi:SDR family oxidoreductase [Sphingomonas sp. RP10(2022)]|uniref:SDR family oxidoreductase n=1 Tax=Sphingomonas liriopis TaxID=2949094 RepID=A0A9X2HU17_9SPHN|nr:SDR family oxidoreductase [Sphingomonas liriopis]MCP3733488.1 SDR family oxidoreductase [Sphingomonas liriopis]
MGRLEGKVAIVTGAGRMGNIGVAICEAFLREGAKGVVATDLRDDDVAAIRARLSGVAAADAFHFVPHDVTDEGDWARVVHATVSRFGALDVLVNNAGISVHGGVVDTSLADLRRAMAVNHDALFLGMKACLPALLDSATRFAGGGAIVNNLSMASYMPNANNLGYHVSKAAGRMLTLCAASEFGPQRVRVNSVHPGLTMTPLIHEAFDDYTRAGMWDSAAAAEAAIAAMAPLGVSGQPEDTAHAFVYLASEESRFVTGASIYHDGGLGRRF